MKNIANKISIIVALSRNKVIGYNGNIPWHLPDDMQYFKKNTMGKPILMGRRTWESIGTPLIGRKIIILSNNKTYQPFSCTTNLKIASSIEEALDNPLCVSAPEIMVIGGELIFKQILPVASKIYLTLIDTYVQGDTFFPNWNGKEWQITYKLLHKADSKHKWPFYFIRMDRIIDK